MELTEKSAFDLLKMLKTKQTSAVELMQATLAQIDTNNGPVNAIVSLRDQEALLDEAAQADAMPRQGALHGLPMAIKDLADAKGLPTSMGSPLHAGKIATADGLMVGRLRAAGAIIIGKTNTPEFGLGSHTFNPVHGVTRNPYDLSRSAGGSSGGAAVALAVRMLALADGSDMMGSLRNPAAWNNVYGLRPSWGLVPSGLSGDSFLNQLSTLGPMARSPSDIATLLDVQAGPDPRLPHGRTEAGFMPDTASDLVGKRIGWLGDWGGTYPMEPGILVICSAALQTLSDLGAQVEDLAPPFEAEQLWDSWTTLRSWSIAGDSGLLYLNKESYQALKPAMIWEIERGLSLSAMQVHAASVIRSDWYRRAAKLFSQFDALILPSAQTWPFPSEWVFPEEINGTAMDSYHRWMEVVVPVSLAGFPALNLPVGFGDKGLPMGVQMFGPRGADRALLQIGEAYHYATNWCDRFPPGRP
ncbi:MAG: amidase [Paracoccaceae bacterium]|nr:amidase [Paracoccaceae bacterium]